MMMKNKNIERWNPQFIFISILSVEVFMTRYFFVFFTTAYSSSLCSSFIPWARRTITKYYHLYVVVNRWMDGWMDEIRNSWNRSKRRSQRFHGGSDEEGVIYAYLCILLPWRLWLRRWRNSSLDVEATRTNSFQYYYYCCHDLTPPLLFQAQEAFLNPF